MIDRRNFMRSMIGGVAATVAVRTWPFRVYSFPTTIKSPTIHISQVETKLLGRDYYTIDWSCYPKSPLWQLTDSVTIEMLGGGGGGGRA